MFDTIAETIKAEVKKAKFFAVICDEVQDADPLNRITFVVRYVSLQKQSCYASKVFGYYNYVTIFSIKKIVNARLEIGDIELICLNNFY